MSLSYVGEGASLEALRFLKKNIMATIATSTPEGGPEAAAMYYVADDDFTLYFVTRRDSRKYENLDKNRRIAVVVADQETVETVQAEGDVEVLSGLGEIAKFMSLVVQSPILERRLRVKPPLKFMPPKVMNGDEGDHFVILRLRPAWLRWMGRSKEGDAPEYTQVIPMQPIT
jgi:uncharacterized pyridoxamine 5'-phosphate oxidase family protein